MNEIKYIKVEGHPDLVRDTSSGAIINVNKTAYDAYIDSKNRKLNEMNRIENLEDSVSKLSQDMNDIKNLMSRILEKL